MGRRGQKRRLELETEYWRLLQSGMGTFEACRIVGIGRKTGYRWRAESGGVPPARLAEDVVDDTTAADAPLGATLILLGGDLVYMASILAVLPLVARYRPQWMPASHAPALPANAAQPRG